MNTKKVILVAMLANLIVISQVALAFLPNVELVTLLVLIYTKHYGKKMTLLIVFVFTTILGLIWGFGTWVIMYYIIYSLYVILSSLILKRLTSINKISFYLAFLGLIFGLLFSLEALIYQSMGYAIIYFIKGIPFDIVHAVANFLIGLYIYEYADRIITKLNNYYFNK